MAAYQLLASNTGVLRTADNAYVPDDPGNRDWVTYQAWLKAGNTADPVPQPSTDDLWKEIRSKRDELLAACDWSVLPDSPLTSTDLATAKQYRNTLRQIPQTYSDPTKVIWPDVPTILEQR